MRQINADEFKKIAFQLLESFHAVCMQNGLQYVLDYGTLLGSIRHGGFIPWDDDIDVTMPRSDFEKLIKLACQNKNLFGENYRLSDASKANLVRKPVANLIDLRTVVESPNRCSKYFYPIWIDIFPMDNAPATDEETEKAYRKIQREIWYTRKAMDRREGRFRTARIIFGGINEPFIEYRLRKADKYAKSFDNGGKLISFMAPYGLKDRVKESYFSNSKMGEFEGSSFPIPGDYDQRLKSLYGDYMPLPPPEKRISHSTKAFWL